MSSHCVVVVVVAAKQTANKRCVANQMISRRPRDECDDDDGADGDQIKITPSERNAIASLISLELMMMNLLEPRRLPLS